MRKILLLLFIFCSAMAMGQGSSMPKNTIPVIRILDLSRWFNNAGYPTPFVAIPGYTNISARYKWIAGAFDSALHVGLWNGVPTGVRTGVWQADGEIAMDTTTGYFYGRQGGVWIKYAKYSDIGSGNFVDSVYRTPGKDSIQFSIAGRYHAIKDSTGAYRFGKSGEDDIALEDRSFTLNKHTFAWPDLDDFSDTVTWKPMVISVDNGQMRKATYWPGSGGSSVTLQSKGVLLGNSTVAAYSCGSDVASFLMTKQDSALGTTITTDAVAGHSIAQQRAVWEADPNKATYDWIIIEVGLNDLLDTTEATSTVLARYQRLVDTVNAQKKAGATVIVSAMTPCKARLVYLLGTSGGNNAYQKWLAMNNAIMGGQPNRITGVNYRINEHSPYLQDTAGNLLSQYNCGDDIHENNAGRKIIAAAWRKKLASLGYLTTTSENSSDFLSGLIDGIGVFNNDGRLGSNSNFKWDGELLRITNSNNSGQPGYRITNNVSNFGALVYNGAGAGPTANWPGNMALYSGTSLLLQSDAAVSSGGTATIKFVTGGLSNTTPALILDGSNDATFARKIIAASLSSGGVAADSVLVVNSSGEVKKRNTSAFTGAISDSTAFTLQRDTITIASFGGGGNQAGDTSTFSTSTIYGSFYNDGSDTLVITSIRAVLQGTSPSLVPTVYYNDSINVTAGATKLVNSPSALTNTSVGVSSTPDNQKIPPGNWVWVKTETVTTKPIYFSLTLLGYKKRR